MSEQIQKCESRFNPTAYSRFHYTTQSNVQAYLLCPSLAWTLFSSSRLPRLLSLSTSTHTHSYPCSCLLTLLFLSSNSVISHPICLCALQFCSVLPQQHAVNMAITYNNRRYYHPMSLLIRCDQQSVSSTTTTVCLLFITFFIVSFSNTQAALVC